MVADVAMPRLPRLVVLISGGGSNLQAFIDAITAGTLRAVIACVISNRPLAHGLQRAEQAGIATCVLEHTDFSSREDYDHALLAAVQQCQPDLVLLAGFMRFLTAVFVDPLYGKLINIHPSLLPKYTGLHTHQRAIEAGDSEAGVTVHFVSPELDSGPAIIQARVPVLRQDTADILAARVLAVEHQLYPLVTQWFCEGRLYCAGDAVYFDDQKLPRHGKTYL